MTLSRLIVAEGLGTAFLLSAVVGSGIMGEKLAGGNVANSRTCSKHCTRQKSSGEMANILVQKPNEQPLTRPIS